jgi:hypothetical protein
MIHQSNGSYCIGFDWESSDLNDSCIMFSPANIAGLGKRSSEITASIYESMREPDYLSRAGAAQFQDGQLVHRLHGFRKHGFTRTNSQWQPPQVC